MPHFKYFFFFFFLKPDRKCITSEQIHSIKKICSFSLKLPVSEHKSKNVMKNVENRFKVQMLAHSIDMCD